jgi:DNA repair protein RadC
MRGPRERLWRNGATGLSDAELLSLVLATGPSAGGVAGMAGARLAESLLASFGSLEAVFAADPAQLVELRGIGPGKASRLAAIREIGTRLWRAEREIERPAIGNSQSAFRLFAGLAHEEQEVVAAAFLDTRNRLIRTREVFRGTLSSSPAQPREILREALKANASRLIVAHNHPSGNVQPSAEDERFTHRLFDSAHLVGVPLVDSLVIGRRGTYYSFADAGGLTPSP